MTTMKAKAGPSPKHKGGKVHAVHVRRAGKGFISEVHHEQPQGAGMYQPPQETPHQSYPEASAHMAQAFGESAEPPEPAGEPKDADDE